MFKTSFNHCHYYMANDKIEALKLKSFKACLRLTDLCTIHSLLQYALMDCRIFVTFLLLQLLLKQGCVPLLVVKGGSAALARTTAITTGRDAALENSFVGVSSSLV